MTVANVPPELQVNAGRVGLGRHVAGLGDRHLEHEAAAVVSDPAHHVQAARRATHPDVILRAPTSSAKGAPPSAVLCVCQENGQPVADLFPMSRSLWGGFQAGVSGREEMSCIATTFLMR